MSVSKSGAAKARLVICLDADTLTCAELNGRADRPRRWASEPLGPGVRRADAAEVGRRLGAMLESERLPRGKAIYAATRSDVVMKHLAIPNAGILRDDVLHQAVQLQVKRQLAMPADEAAIDYALVPGDDAERPVLAAAMPHDRIEWLRTMCETAGIELGAIGLRPAALAARVTGERTTLLVWIGPGSVEFVVCREGRLVFARGVDLGATAIGNLPERVRVEAGRTLMSYRVQSGLPAVEAIHLAGRRAPGLAARFASEHGLPVSEEAVESGEAGAGEREASTGSATGDHAAGATGRERDAEPSPGPADHEPISPAEGPGTAADLPADLPADLRGDSRPGAPGGDRAGLGAEAGLPEDAREAAVWAIGAIRRAMSIDFLAPTTPRDHASRRRQLVLAAAGVLILGGYGLFMVGKMEIDELKRQKAALDEEATELSGRYAAYLLDAARAHHIGAWDEQRVAWDAHLAELVGQMPDRDHARLNGLTARASSVVGFDRTRPVQSASGWSGRGAVTLAFEATIPDREQAMGFRERVIEGGVYEVQNKGADEPGRVSWTLVSPELTVGGDETGAAASAAASGTRGGGAS